MGSAKPGDGIDYNTGKEIFFLACQKNTKIIMILIKIITMFGAGLFLKL